LSWAAEQATWMVLSSSADFFVTSALTGCAIGVGGSCQAPRVVHANHSSGSSHVLVALMRCGFFAGDSDGAAFFDDDAIEQMSTRHGLHGALGPRVFGTRNSKTGAWNIYSHLTVTNSSNMKVAHARTELLWPTRAVAARCQ
jgi:hypothetical protein